MTFAIRAMQSGDLDAVALIAAACPEAPQWGPSAYAAYLAPDPANAALLRSVLVADQDCAVLAFACATLLLDGEQNLCQLDSMAVHPGARRHGIGFALLQHLLDWAARSGARRFSLEVRASNDPALRLYERFGLRQEGRRPRYYADPEEDALLLGRPITPGSPSPVFHDQNS